MRVGLNLIYLVPGETGGMETHARELIPALQRVRSDIELTAFVSEEGAADRDAPWHGIRCVTVPVRSRNRLQWVRGEQLLLPRLARRAGCELVHSLGNTAPLRGRFVRVTTINDLMYHVHPEAHFGVRGLGMRALVPAAARRSHRVLAISQNTKDDIVRHLKVDPGKIDVTLLGLGAPPSASPVPEADLRARHHLGGRPVALSTSAKRPHKNLPRLLEALAMIEPQERPLLVLPGYPTPHEEELREHARALGIADDVRFLGWVDAAELEGLYELARVFVFPSLYEGFGLPVLEAMRRGVPVACSAGGALDEVAGDAALVFDPRDPRAMADALQRLLTDEAERERLRAAGTERAKGFTWEATARATAEAYDRALAAA